MEAKKQLIAVEQGTKGGRRLRSPGYPGIDLQNALRRAWEFYTQEKRNAANIGVAVEHWGFKPKSSGGLVAVAALKAFGLLGDTGSGKGRKVQLTELALRILLDKRPDSAERDAAIKEAALRPKIHAALWAKYLADLPSDDNLRHELIFERKFNENAVGDFIREYRETIGYAKLKNSDTVSGSEEDKTEESQMPRSDQRLTGVTDPPPVPKTPTDWMAPAGSGEPQRSQATAVKAQPPAVEISVPVGTTDDGTVVFARIAFGAPLRKEMLNRLKQVLNALEGNLESLP